ncbi:unnamed protein product [Oikopleura dioica]|uniref:Integrase catalytic domain-containing protein n=1 Tax=Oikopleura dioica TaxID=34765 RepID=E4XLH4_OIKDI|nr:unnamed protein product [Oikopleura dioica]
MITPGNKAILIEEAVLKSVCSHLEYDPQNPGIVRFTAPKTKLEPYPAYDETEKANSEKIAAAAGVRLKVGKRFENKDETGSESESENSTDEYTEDDFTEASEESDRSTSGSPQEEASSEYDDEDEPGDGGSEDSNGGDRFAEDEVEPAPRLFSDYAQPKPNRRQQPRQQQQQQLPSNRDDVDPRPIFASRAAYESSKAAGEGYKRDRAKYLRSRWAAQKREIEAEDELRRSKRVKSARAKGAYDSRSFERVVSPAVAKRSNRKVHFTGIDESEHESPRQAPANFSASAAKRKVGSILSNASSRGAKRAGNSRAAARASKRNADNVDIAESPAKKIVKSKSRAKSAPVAPKRKVGRVVRGYVEPDKPESARGKSRNGESGRESAADPDAVDDVWAPGKPLPDCDSYDRTIQERFERYFASHGNLRRWIHQLQRLVESYNNTVHSSTNMKPVDVTNENSRQLYIKLQSNLIKKRRRNLKPKYKVGDLVRIPIHPLPKFTKGARAKWTKELYKIIKIDLGRRVPMYYVANPEGAVYPRRLYEKELNKVSSVLD